MLQIFCFQETGIWIVEGRLSDCKGPASGFDSPLSRLMEIPTDDWIERATWKNFCYTPLCPLCGCYLNIYHHQYRLMILWKGLHGQISTGLCPLYGCCMLHKDPILSILTDDWIERATWTNFSRTLFPLWLLHDAQNPSSSMAFWKKAKWRDDLEEKDRKFRDRHFTEEKT